jgi:hypothetical protein
MNPEVAALDTTAPRKKNVLWVRIFWSLAGSGVNYLLIATPFKYLHAHTHLPTLAISAMSYAVGVTVFFFWNYFVNFRTAMHKHEALKRYLLVATTMYIIQSLILTGLKSVNFGHSLSLGKIPLDLDVIATQILGSFKFILYHLWAFPVEKRPAADS